MLLKAFDQLVDRVGIDKRGNNALKGGWFGFTGAIRVKRCGYW